MPFDNNGNWTSDFYPETDRDNQTPILASKFQKLIQSDLKSSFENCLTRDGVGKPVADLNFAGHRINNLGEGSSKTDGATVGQVQKNLFSYSADTSLSPNAVEITLSPSISDYVQGQSFYFVAKNTNTASEVSFRANSAELCRISIDGKDDLPIGAIRAGVAYHGVFTQNENTSETLYSGRRLQILGTAVDWEKVLNHTQVTDCVISAPNGIASFMGLTVTTKEDLKVLLFSGENDDGTIKNTEYLTPATATYTFVDTVADGTYFLFIDAENVLTVATSPQRQNGKCLLAKCFLENGIISAFETVGTLEIVKMQDLAPKVRTLTVPDYTSGEVRELNINYTAQKAGVVIINGYSIHNNYSTFSINEVEVAKYGSTRDSYSNFPFIFGYFYVKRGDIYKWDGAVSQVWHYKFFPCEVD